MVISGIDKKETSKLKIKAERNESRLQQMKKQKVNKCKSQTQACFDEANEQSTNSASSDVFHLKTYQSQTVQAKKWLLLVIGQESRIDQLLYWQLQSCMVLALYHQSI